MKRSGPPQRKTPLKAKKPMDRGRSQLQRGLRDLDAAAERANGPRSRAPVKDTGPTPAQKAAVWDRDGNRCQWCGRRDVSQIHHRLPRGRGGDNRLSNLIVLCGSGTTGCHGRVEHNRALAYDHGLLVKTGVDPAEQVVLTYRGWGYLTDDGTWLAEAAA